VANVWDELHPYGDDFRTAGNNVVVLGGCMVRGRGSGAEADTPTAWVVSVHEGKITSHRGYRTRNDALEAAGLRD
jgi:ketosteroid isomerase-like protein